MSTLAATDARIESIAVSAYKIPTDQPESDGTYTWSSTTLVLVEIEAEGETGLGYTYSDRSVAQLIVEKLSDVIRGESAFEIPRLSIKLVQAVRNIGRVGLAATAISAIDVALWDLKAKLLCVPLCRLLGNARPSAEVYGSGGFTSYSDRQLQEQLSNWVEQGIDQVKMKVGREPDRDPDRVRAAREAIGDTAGLMVDANGAYRPKQALALSQRFAAEGVCWFEEPVSSDDLHILRFLRRRMPAEIEVAAGEYGYTPQYFRRVLEAQAVDVLQADATRCGGLSGFLQAAALCDAFHIDLSSHCAPALHVAACCAAPHFRHMEYFHDHVRIEQMLFEGFPPLVDGKLVPATDRPGLGLTFRRADARKFGL
jgi:L-alanine-DL-glutamate epimerase-like enolase superfamily enzyme